MERYAETQQARLYRNETCDENNLQSFKGGCMTEKDIKDKLERLGKACVKDLPNGQLKDDFDFIWKIASKNLANTIWQLSKNK